MWFDLLLAEGRLESVWTPHKLKQYMLIFYLFDPFLNIYVTS